MQQGITIPCVDCTVLFGPNPECLRCGGLGQYFQPAQMCDLSIQWERGGNDRRRCDELRQSRAWDELAEAIRECFISYIIYGPGWASGYLSLAPDEEDFSWERWDPILEAWQQIEPELKREFFAARKKAESK